MFRLRQAADPGQTHTSSLRLFDLKVNTEGLVRNSEVIIMMKQFFPQLCKTVHLLAVAFGRLSLSELTAGGAAGVGGQCSPSRA